MTLRTPPWAAKPASLTPSGAIAHFGTAEWHSYGDGKLRARAAARGGGRATHGDRAVAVTGPDDDGSGLAP